VSEIDAAGGVLGQPVVNEYGDSGDTETDIASQTVDSHLQKGVQAIIGAASSGVTFTVIDKITSNGVLQISPANTAPSLTDYPDNGLYFRTAPSDALQGAVQASFAIDAGFTEGATIARKDPYGEGLQNAFVADFEAGGGTITTALTYDPTAASFEAEVAEIAAGNPEFVQVVGFDESVKLIQEMIKQGIGPQDVQIYLADGNLSTTAFKDFPKDTMTGVIGTVPTGDPSVDVEAFNAKLLEQDPALTDFAYGAQAYDATMLVAIAAEYAGCADGTAIAAAMPMVANADAGGEACGTYADCVAIIQAGGQPNYDGVTGPLDFNEFGDPKSATIDVVQYLTNTKFESIEVVGPVEVPVP
jgi:branched-chain amino acid transport system substrate-binding protein